MQTSASTRVMQGDVAGSRWLLASRVPRTALRPFVRRLDGYEEIASSPQSMRQFPEPHVVVIIEFGPPLRVTLGGNSHSAARHPGGFVAGLGGEYAVTEHRGIQRGIQVDLTATGARRLLRIPLSELAEGVVALRDILPSSYPQLVERLGETPSWTDRLDLVETLLSERILGARLDSASVDWAVGQIERQGGVVDIGSLAGELGFSHKHLIALFRDQVGITPKLLARLVRFERVMHRAREGGGQRGTELALACGYYDQAHLARDVKEFTGFTLTEARSQLPDLTTLLR